MDKYCFVVMREADQYSAVQILDGPLEGAIVKFGQVGFDEQGVDQLVIKFDYEFEKLPYGPVPPEDERTQILGDIVVDIIENHLIGAND